MEGSQEFRPERFSRRGEITAWGLAILAAIAWMVLVARGIDVPLVLMFVTGFTVLGGLAISLTNWMDRRTVLRLGPQGIDYENGLRHVRLSWDEIRQLQVFPSNFGDQVRVIGAKTFFTFRTYAEARLGSQVRSRMGFADGQEIINQIRKSANLNQIERTGSAYYYSRT